jgi:glycosyltransferase involved in cell wall biosynthesis
MRVALVSEHANPLASLGGADAGGQNVHVAALAGGLARRGHDVIVYTRRDSTDAPVQVATADGYVVEHVPAGPPADVPKDELLPYMPAFGDYLRRRWRSDPVDVVHAHFWMSGLAAVQATRGTTTPVLQTFHALGSVKRRQQGALDTSPPQRIELERRLCRTVDHVIATCSDEVANLRELGLPPGRATVIPCGVDVRAFRPLPGCGDRAQVVPDAARAPGATRAAGQRLLVIGRLVTRKGVGNVVEALAQLPGVELTIAGGPRADALEADPQVDRLRRLAARLGVADRVRFVGGVARDDVPALMCRADVVVTVPWYEPFGIVPLEAMACGRPVVGSAVGGLLDTVVPGVTGELVAPRRPDLLAEVLRDLLADPERRESYGRAGRERAVRRYQWSRVAASTEEVYAAVASTPATPMGVRR